MATLVNSTCRGRRAWGAGMLLLLVGAALIGCQAGGPTGAKPARVAEAAQLTPAASATPTATPTRARATPERPTSTPHPTLTPTPALATMRALTTPTPGPRTTVDEMEAAGKVIPLPKALPRGPRKPPPARLIIRAIGVDARVIELGTRLNDQGDLVWETAPFAAGHHVGTANPGEPGNVVISGHISSQREGDVFKRLPQIKIGDGVIIGTGDRNYIYQVVDARIVEPTEVDVMNATPEETLTLITCVPDGVYTHRLIVTAKRV